MDRLQKIFILTTLTILLATIGCGLFIRLDRDIFFQESFFHLFARYDLPGAMLLIMVLLAGIILALRLKTSWIDKSLAAIQNNASLLAGALFCVLAFGAFFIYHHHPLTMDEFMPCFQARIFAQGKLWGQYPPPLVPWLLKPYYFSIYSAQTGHVISDYWPGFALLLTPFMKLGVPWLLNPLIGTGTIVLFGHYLKQVLPDTDSAAWGILLTVSSAVFILNGISFYSMNAHLFFNLLYATLLLRLTPGRLFLAGLTGSLALVLHNPVPHFLFAIPWILWIALKKKRFRNLGLLFAGYLPLVLLLGVGWFYLKVFVIPHATLTPLLSSGKAASASFSSINIVAKSLKTIQAVTEYVFMLPSRWVLWVRFLGSLKVYAWAVAGLPILAFIGLGHIRGKGPLQLWCWSTVFTFGGYIFVSFSQGHGWGFRYFHSVWLVLPLLAAAFLTANPLKQDFWKKYVFTLAVLSLVFCTALRFYQAHQFIGEHLAQLPAMQKGAQYICLLDMKNGYYIADLLQNDPFLRDPIVMMRKIAPEKDRQMIKRFFPKATLVSDTKAATVWQLPERTGTILDPDISNSLKLK